MDTAETLVAVYAHGRSWSFRRGDPDAASVYGGPLAERVSGQAFGPAPLHHVASLSAASLPFMGKHFLSSIPLVYGFRYDGCDLVYRFETNEIEVVRLSPATSTADWPYADYPPLLPYIPIVASSPIEQDWQEFAEPFNLYSDEPPSELVAVVPPAFLIGHSLWGRSGDLEGVCVVFECDLRQRRVRTYNVCS